MIRPILLGLVGLWVSFTLCTCIPVPSDSSEIASIPAQKAVQVSHAQPSDRSSLPSFWKAFQKLARTGSPASMVSLTRFPVFQYGDHLMLQDWISQANVEWLGTDATLQFIEEEELVPVDLTPYGIHELDQPQGFAAEIPLPETGGTCVLLFGKVEGAYTWVGKIP